MGNTNTFGGMKFRVMWLKNGKERKSAWYRKESRAERLYKFMIAKGYQAIIYVD